MKGPLIERRKKLARILLYGAPLVLVAGGLLLIRHLEDLGFKDWNRDNWLELEEVRLLQGYLQIDTSNPSGNELPGAEYLAGILEANGIPAKVERIGDRGASLIATLEGENQQALVLHHHIDVLGVPAFVKKTKYPPYSGVIDPPFIYGRGAFDMKSYGIAQLMAMLELKRSGKKLGRSLTLLATGDEEADGALGVRFLLPRHPEWKEQFWGVLTEGGAIEAMDLDRARYWGTEFVHKMMVQLKVCDSRKERLADLSAELRKVPRVRRVVPQLIPFFKSYAATRDRPDTRELLSEPETMLARMRSFKRNIDVTVMPPYIDEMLADELKIVGLVPNQDGGPGWELYLSFWVLPGRSYEDAFAELIGDRLTGFDYEVADWYDTAVASPVDHPLFTGLDAFMKERHPEVPHGPLFVPGATNEGRYFRPAGIPSYGFTPFWILSGDGASMKGGDERIPLPAFVAGVELYEDLVERLVEAKSEGYFPFD